MGQKSKLNGNCKGRKFRENSLLRFSAASLAAGFLGTILGESAMAVHLHTGKDYSDASEGGMLHQIAAAEKCEGTTFDVPSESDPSQTVEVTLEDWQSMFTDQDGKLVIYGAEA